MPQTWKWTVAKEQAAQLLAQGDLTTHKISSRLGISESTLFNWKRVPDFQKRVEENLEQVKLEIAQQAAIEYRYRTTWHEGALDKVLKVIGSLSFQDFNPMRRSPNSLINLAISLQKFAKEIERAKNNLTPTEWEAEQMRIINDWHLIFDDDKDLDPAERAEFLAGFEAFYEAHPNCRPQPPHQPTSPRPPQPPRKLMQYTLQVQTHCKILQFPTDSYSFPLRRSRTPNSQIPLISTLNTQHLILTHPQHQIPKSHLPAQTLKNSTPCTPSPITHHPSRPQTS